MKGRGRGNAYVAFDAANELTIYLGWQRVPYYTGVWYKFRTSKDCPVVSTNAFGTLIRPVFNKNIFRPLYSLKGEIRITVATCAACARFRRETVQTRIDHSVWVTLITIRNDLRKKKVYTYIISVAVYRGEHSGLQPSPRNFSKT